MIELAHLRPRVWLWMIFHAGEKVTSERWVSLAQQKLQPFEAAVPFASGANAYFAELNRERPASGASALPCYSINPQVHARDHRSLIENLSGQGIPSRRRSRFSGGRLSSSPVTLRPLSQPDATSDGAQKSEVERRLKLIRARCRCSARVGPLGSIASVELHGARAIA